jgi:hypothetical protein
MENKITPCLPGMKQFQTMRLTDPSSNDSGLATKPYNRVNFTKIKQRRPFLKKKELKSVGGEENMGVILAPGLALFCEPTTSDTA